MRLPKLVVRGRSANDQLGEDVGHLAVGLQAGLGVPLRRSRQPREAYRALSAMSPG